MRPLNKQGPCILKPYAINIYLFNRIFCREISHTVVMLSQQLGLIFEMMGYFIHLFRMVFTSCYVFDFSGEYKK